MLAGLFEHDLDAKLLEEVIEITRSARIAGQHAAVERLGKKWPEAELVD